MSDGKGGNFVLRHAMMQVAMQWVIDDRWYVIGERG